MLSSNNSKTILVCTVGTTEDPIKFSIEKNSPDKVILVYGKSLNQENSPVKVVAKIMEELQGKNIEVEEYEIRDPESIENCLQEFSGIVEKINKSYENSKVILNITGGTKVMSAAAFHVFMRNFLGDFFIEYIGGRNRDEYGRVIGSMKEKLVPSYKLKIDEIVKYIEKYEFYIASKLCEQLPQTTGGKFLRNASSSLLFWDNFEYEKGLQIAREIYSEAKVYKEETKKYGKVPEMIIKIVRESGDKIVNCIKSLRKLQNGEKEKIDIDASQMLIADIIANAERRLATLNFVECVLRSYRAVEAAFQLKVLDYGLNPWKIENIEKLIDVEKFKQESSLTEIPEKFSLNHCFIFLKTKNPELEKIEKDLRTIQQIRNSSFLAHGYNSVAEENAKKCLENAKKIISTVMGKNIEDSLEKVRI